MSAPAAPDPPRRARGGQPGNTNALRHGFYARARLTARTTQLLGEAREHGSLQDDIDLLRVEIARMFESGDVDPRNLAALSKALTAAIALDARLGASERSELDSAVDNVLADVRSLLTKE